MNFGSHTTRPNRMGMPGMVIGRTQVLTNHVAAGCRPVPRWLGVSRLPFVVACAPLIPSQPANILT